jgi:hypothetical protein
LTAWLLLRRLPGLRRAPPLAADGQQPATPVSEARRSICAGKEMTEGGDNARAAKGESASAAIVAMHTRGSSSCRVHLHPGIYRPILNHEEKQNLGNAMIKSLFTAAVLLGVAATPSFAAKEVVIVKHPHHRVVVVNHRHHVAAHHVLIKKIEKKM